MRPSPYSRVSPSPRFSLHPRAHRLASTVRVLALVSLTVSASACNPVPKHARPGPLARFQAQTPAPTHPVSSDTVAQRALAQEAPSSGCFRQGSQGAALRAEILRLERQQAGPPVAGSFAPAGLDLSTLPRAQALYLQRFGADLAQLPSANYRGCTELSCLLNRYHGTPDASDTGLQAYWWFLKTGSALTVSSQPPEHAHIRASYPCPSGQSRPDEHRFTPEEIQLFVDTVRALPEAFLAQVRFNRVFRFRQGAAFVAHPAPEGASCPRPTQTCGVPVRSSCASSTCAVTAFSTSGNRFLLFSDPCINPATRNFRAEQEPLLADVSALGQAWFALSHELAHLFDASSVETSINMTHSDSPEWLNLSGWQLTTERDPRNRQEHRVYQQVRRSPSVTTYASQSPAEDFAETLAYARFQPGFTFRQVPEKVRFVQQRAFGNVSFSPDAVTERLLAQAATALGARLASLAQGLSECSNSVAPSALNLPGSQATRLPPNARACLAQALEQAIEQEFAKLRLREPEACGVLRAESAPLKNQLLVRLGPELDQALAQSRSVEDTRQAERELERILSQSVDPRELLISCMGAPLLSPLTPQDCYTTRLREVFNRISGSYVSRISMPLDTLWTRFHSLHSFLPTLEQARNGYASYLGEERESFEREARTVWESCQTPETLPLSVPTQPTLAPYSGGSDYLDPRILHCLNDRAARLLRDTIERAFSVRGDSASEATARFVEQEVLVPWLQETLAPLQAQAKTREAQAIETLRNRVQPEIQAQAARSAPALEQAITESDALAACRTALGAVGSGRAQWPELLYHSIDELLGDWTHEACRARLAQPALQSQLQRRRALFVRALPSLEGSLQAEGARLLEDCHRQNPAAESPTQTRVRLVRACFEERWARTLERAFERWLQADGAPFAAAQAGTPRAALERIAHRVKESLFR